MKVTPLLSVRDLRTFFGTNAGEVRAVDGVSFDVMPGEVFGVVGESGSGKSVAALSILGLIPKPPGRVEAAAILWKERDIRKLSEEELRQLRGTEISMIFQDPMTSLNPVFTIGQQIIDVIRAHRDVSKAEARERAVEVLSIVGIPNPNVRLDDYPHQFSGGMRQRALIAMAIANDPDLIIADEPTTALDVTIQAQVLDVLTKAAETTHSAVILITHDLGVVAGVVNRVAVMYSGRIVEEGSVDGIYYRARMPYTWGLMESISRLDQRRMGRLRPIAGQPPSLLRPPSGCRFHPRCPYRDEGICRTQEPDLLETELSHTARCHFALEPGWFSPAERLVQPWDAWHPRVQAREREVSALEAMSGESFPGAPVGP
ncbi:MAG: ABC transporter ATP-binding protein [Actinomycetota bacterium]|nr:ABC transporter ATP-binding protein [Actinomycetota bacterium]